MIKNRLVKKQISSICLWLSGIIFSILILHVLVYLFQLGFMAVGFLVIAVAFLGLGMYLE